MTTRRPLPMTERLRLWDSAMRELLGLTAARLAEQQSRAPQATPPAPDRRDGQ